MKSIYDILVDWHDTDPEFIFLEYKNSYTLNDIIHEVESLSKSLSYIPSNHIGIHISSKLDCWTPAWGPFIQCWETLFFV